MIRIGKRLFILGTVLLSSSNFLSAQITFQKAIGGINIEDIFSAKQTSDGGFIMTGGIFSSGFASEVYLIKTDLYGNVQWTKTFGGTSDDFGLALQQTMDGGYIVAGITNSFGAGFQDIYLIKTDSNGNLIWSKTYGGTDSDYSYSVEQTSDGGYVVAGSTITNGSVSSDLYMIKTDANGDTLWTKIFGLGSQDAGYSIHQTTDNGYIVAGSSLGWFRR